MAAGLAGMASSGCLPLHDPQRLAAEWGPGAWTGLPPPSPPGWHWLLAAVLGLMTALGLAAWLAHRFFFRQAEEGGEATVDREDLALLRTARQAVGFLLSKRLKQLRVVSLADWVRGRDSPNR